MKKQYLPVLLLGFLVLGVFSSVSVSAETSFDQNGNKIYGDPIDKMIPEERRASSTERKASSTERRIEFQQGIAKRKADHTARVLTATVERLGKIATRLESRIAKVDAAGGTTTDAKIFVAEARNHLALATSSIALFASLDLIGDKAQENFEKVRTLAKEIKGHIREAHRSLKNAVRVLKGVSTGT